MHIKGLIKNSLVDFGGHIAAVVFTGGCNFCCPFCQNAELVTGHQQLSNIPEAEILGFLQERRGFLDGLVISGGEPTLQPDLGPWLAQIREIGLAIKLDTNGYRPQALASLIQNGLVDFVAMDIKSVPQRYHEAAGVPVDLARIQESLSILRSSGVAHELRTTVVPGIINPEDMDALAKFIAGDSPYALQQYRPEGVLRPEFQGLTPYPISILEKMAARLCALGIPAIVRGT